MENNAIIYGVKSNDKFHYIGKTNKRRVNVDKPISNSKVQVRYTNKNIGDIFRNYENVSVEPIVFVPENEWYNEKLREVVEQASKNQPLVNAKWMIEGKRGYWEGKTRDAHTILMLSESKYRQFVEYDKDGKLKKIWKSGKEAATKVFEDYRVVNGGGKSKLYSIIKSASMKYRFAHNSYWFGLEELIIHFNGIPEKLNIQNMMKREAENRRVNRILNRKEKTTTTRSTIERYERKTNELVAVYKNAEEAGYCLKVSADTIRCLCSGRTKPAADFILKYGEKTVQSKIIKFPPYQKLPLQRVLIDTESRIAKEKEERRLLKEQMRLEAIEQERLEAERQILAKQQERQQRLESKDATNIRIDDLFDLLSVRTRNCLGRAGIITLGELIQYERKDLMYIRNFGVKCLSEIEEILSDKSLSLLQQIEKEKQVLTEKQEIPENNDVLNIRIATIDEVSYTWISVRTLNCLRRAGIITLGDLVKFRKKDLMCLRNFGIKCFYEVEELLDEFNLKLL